MEAVLELGLLSVVLGKKQKPGFQQAEHVPQKDAARLCLLVYKKALHQYWCQSILAMLGSFTSIRFWQLQLSFPILASFVLPLLKAQWFPGLMQYVRMKLSEQLWQGKKGGSSGCFI